MLWWKSILSSGEHRREILPQVGVQESFSDVVWYEGLKIWGLGVKDEEMVGVEERLFQAEAMVQEKISVTEM